jgi:Glycosyltransferase like family 2
VNVFASGIEVHNSISNQVYSITGNDIEELNLADFLISCPIAHPTVLMKREYILKLGGYNENYRAAEDYELWSRVTASSTIIRSPQIVLKYRFHENNVSNLKMTIQNQESRHVKFNILLKQYGIKPCIKSHRVGEGLYCRYKFGLLKGLIILMSKKNRSVELRNLNNLMVY